MNFMIYGPFKPYTRMTQRSKYRDPQAQEYLNSQENIGWQYKQQMQERNYNSISQGTPFNVHIVIYMPTNLHCQDLDNQAKALVDAAKGIVFPNDLWMDNLTASRAPGSEFWTTVTIIPHDPAEIGEEKKP